MRKFEFFLHSEQKNSKKILHPKKNCIKIKKKKVLGKKKEKRKKITSAPPPPAEHSWRRGAHCGGPRTAGGGSHLEPTTAHARRRWGLRSPDGGACPGRPRAALLPAGEVALGLRRTSPLPVGLELAPEVRALPLPVAHAPPLSGELNLGESTVVLEHGRGGSLNGKGTEHGFGGGRGAGAWERRKPQWEGDRAWIWRRMR